MKKRPSDSGVHLFSTIGFLDDSEMHRSVWMYGKDSFGGCWGFPVPTFVNPSGQILCVKGDTVYGYGRQFYNEGRQPFMHLFAMDKNPQAISYEERFKGKAKKDRRGGPHIQSRAASVPVSRWSKTIDTYVRALLVGAHREGKSDLLFAIGFPEIIDEYDAIQLINDQQRRGLNVERIYLKEKSIAGELGAKMMVVAADTGEVLSETKLDAPAVFDGMSAANGKIFISDIEGNVVCLRPSKDRRLVEWDLPAIDDNDAATARGNNPPHQTATEAFDNDITTKWLDFSPEGSWIQYDCKDKPKVVTRYVITSAEDAPARDPRDWQLLGSSDGKTWTTLDTRTDELWSLRNEPRSFNCENTKAYKFYRLNISTVRDVKTANSVQIAEIELLK